MQLKMNKRKILIIIALSILYLSSTNVSGLDATYSNSFLYSNGTLLSFREGNDPSELPDIEILKSDLDSVIIKADIPGVQLEQKEVNGKKFQVLMIPGYGITTEVGKAQLPLMRVLLAIPSTVDVSINILEANYSILQGYNIYPAQEPIPEYLKSNLTINKSFYSLDRFYPGKIADISDPGMLREYSVIQLQIYPVWFNPSSDELMFYDEITIEIEYNGQKIEQTVEKEVVSKNLFEETYKKSILNYDSTKKYPTATLKGQYFETNILSSESGDELKNTSNRCDYLVITHDNFYDGVIPLAEDKQDKGLEVKVVNLSDIYNEFPGNDNDTIRDFIDYAYHNWTLAPTYILLVGDVEYVPTNYGLYHEYQGNYVATDLYYSTVAGDDYLPDL